jgi:hypothetical protein
VPTGGFGTREGANFVAPTGVTYCDGTAFDFYATAEGYCDAPLTVLIRSAEWCQPCQREARAIGENGALDAYAEAGVRFLTVLDQDRQFDPPGQGTCEGWERGFELDQAVIDHRMLRDGPNQEVSIYFPPGEDGYPGNVIVNDRGVIVRRIIGSDLMDLRAALDELLGR